MANREILHSLFASFCGGFDIFEQNLFINATHLYLFIILLSLPFIIFMYFPTNITTWIVYCIIIFVLVTTLKLINLSLHKMYDKARTLSETSLKKLSSGNTGSGIANSKIQRETSGEDEGGIELQILNNVIESGGTLPIDHSSRTSVEHHSQSDELSCANSAVSVDFQEHLASTIDLKVDVHRKNSSESSDNSENYQLKKVSSSSERKTRSSGSNNKSNDINNSSKQQTRTSSSDNNLRVPETASNSISIDKECELSVEKSEGSGRQSNDDTSQASTTKTTEPHNNSNSSIKFHNTASSRRQQYKSLKQKRSTSNVQLQPQSLASKLHRQVSLDSDKIGMGVLLSRDGNNYQMSNRQRHFTPHHPHHHHHFHNAASTVIHPKSMLKNSDSDLYLESGSGPVDTYTTKSALQLTSDQSISMTQSEKVQQNTPIRRDSSSTMSALQLPTVASTSGLLSSKNHRRNSNNANNCRQMTRTTNTSMRRIKSAALETSCKPASVSNLSPHPNSVEVIDGKTIRNPVNSGIPPPSKFLSRNAPQNLFPTSSVTGHSGTSSSATTISETTNALHHVASDLVYPIAEQCDENCPRGVQVTTANSCTSDEDDENSEEDDEGRKDQVIDEDLTSNDGDSGLDQEEINLSDSEDEQNRNGSRSPLLEVAGDVQQTTDDVKVDEASGVQHETPKIENVRNKSGSNEWEQTGSAASSKDHLIVKERRSASEEKRTKWFDSLDFGFSNTESIGELSSAADHKSSDDHQLKVKEQKKKSESNDNRDRVLSSSISASQINGRSLGAIPKQHGHHHRSGIAIRKLSFGEEQYPTSRMYQRTLSQRSTSDRIPENNAIQSTSTLPGLSLIRYLNNHSIDPHNMTPQIFLPSTSSNGGGNQHLYENQTSFSSFRPRTFAVANNDVHNRRLRFGRNSYTIDLNFPNQQQPKQSFVIVDPKSPTSDCDLCLDIPDGMPSTSSSNPNTGRLVITSGSQQNAGFIDSSDFNCFIDDQGHWMHLMNDQKAQTGHTISNNITQLQQQHQHVHNSSNNSNNNNNSIGNNNNNNSNNSSNMNSYYRIMTAAPSAEYSLSSAQSIDIVQQRSIFGEPQIRAKVYKFPIRFCGLKLGKTIKIRMNRLQLLALFDRDQYMYQMLLAIILCTFVAILGSWILHHHFYNDIFAFVFCFTIAGSQYSLLKSVQPDASSPIHGFNKTVTFSRPVYFCLLTSLMLLTHYASESMMMEANDDEKVVNNESSIVVNQTEAAFYFHTRSDVDKVTSIYGIEIAWIELFTSVTSILHWTILCLPVAFSIGLFPQINTFFMYFCEQIDMHVFGGNAICNLLAGFLAIFRSIIGCLILYGPIYGGLVESNNTQHILVSMFCGMLIPMAYHLSRSSSDFTHLFQLIKSTLLVHNDDDICGEVESGSSSKTDDNETSQTSDDSKDHNLNNIQQMDDPLPKKLQGTVTARLKNDLVVCTFLGLVFFALHTSTIFKVLQPNLNLVLHIIAIILGVSLHYIVPQMRKHLPCLCVAAPILRAHEHGMFEVNRLSKIMWFEQVFVYLGFIEKNILYPLIIISAVTADSTKITDKFGFGFGSALIVISSLKALRSSYSDINSQYLILLFSILFFSFDFSDASETFLLDYFLISILFRKISDLLLKLQFVVTYIAPWQITWGSAFHAFAQPFSVPHSAMLFLQTGISAILSTPLNPFLGSAIFITSYARPIKFWERDYNTRRIDHSNTRLSSQLERDLGADDNNLNSIFYEHLTRSLQHSLCGDLLMGRWGNVSQGDCFVLASDYLNCLIHIIELGNGLCTFQMRGLEFRGTYCQQREVEAISEGVEDNDGCCCCSPGHLSHMLSVNAMFSTRWLAWQVIAAQYVLEGYSISDNAAVATLQVFEFRKVLISYYVKSIIYYAIKSPKLQQWLESQSIQEALEPTLERQFVDLDPIFNHNLDDDYDFRVAGISRNSFWTVYSDWIQFCVGKRQQQMQEEKLKKEQAKQEQRKQERRSTSASKETKTAGNSIEEPSPAVTHSISSSRDSILVSLCLALTLLARRTLATASHSASSLGVEFFLHGLHSLFKGDFRITSTRDEWVFADMDLLHSVVAPGVRMSLKLHQDHFLSPDEYDDYNALYESIEQNTRELVISHEADPNWRNAVLRGTPNLLALRHVMEDGTDEYRVIRLTKRFLNFRVIKLNRECVRGLWAGQQQELIYLRNRNPERGSIQNAKQALRNIINSSCDQPIGYPIYVSPLTTSYAETSEQLNEIIGGEITLEKIQNKILSSWHRIRKRCREGCSSGIEAEIVNTGGSCYGNLQTLANSNLSQTAGTLSYGSQSISISGREGSGNRGSLASINKPTSSTLLAGLLNRERLEMAEREIVLRERSISKKNLSTVSTNSIANSNKNKRDSFREIAAMNPAITLTTSTGMTKQESVESQHSSGKFGPESLKEQESPVAGTSQVKVAERKEEHEEDDEVDEPEEKLLIQPTNLSINKKVIIVDISQVYDCMNDQRIDVIWPNEKLQSVGIRSGWRKNWSPKEGMVGFVVGCLSPNHAASSENQNILLVKIDDMCVPITEKGVKEYRVVTSSPLKDAAHHVATTSPKTPLADEEDLESKDDDEQVTL
ncbi:CLUMA_CG000666, isoform A [Clunio marinus]|uniref:Pecanex-like protein n=1 Tax=Clunio marinus TaxID=568069 RepID=A0A1J1HK46_9DIPT|nr:CLUMA_CG000666, isoform A [Clunio marinus]